LLEDGPERVTRENFKESNHATKGCMMDQSAKGKNSCRPLGFWGHFFHSYNELSHIFMYKYVKGFWVEGGSFEC
jgi:hypothetical protein